LKQLRVFRFCRILPYRRISTAKYHRSRYRFRGEQLVETQSRASLTRLLFAFRLKPLPSAIYFLPRASYFHHSYTK